METNESTKPTSMIRCPKTGDVIQVQWKCSTDEAMEIKPFMKDLFSSRIYVNSTVENIIYQYEHSN